MRKIKPKIAKIMNKNMLVKCPHCGWHNRVLKAVGVFVCKKCRRSVETDREYQVDKYY